MATIPLAFQAPQFQDPITQLQKGMTLQQMAQARQIGDQQMAERAKDITAKELANQTAALELKTRQNMLKWYQDAGGALGADTAPTAPTPPAAKSPLDLPGVNPPAPADVPAPVQPEVSGGPVPQASQPVIGGSSVPPVAAPAPTQPATPNTPFTNPKFDPALFYQKLIEKAPQYGMGAQIPRLATEAVDLQTKQAKLIADQATNHQTLADRAAQLLQGITALPIASRDAEYQKVYPRVAELEKQMGGDPNSLPARWTEETDNAIQPLIAQGFKAADYASHLARTADTARLLQNGIITEAPKAHEYVQGQLANIGSQSQLDDLRGQLTALAANEKLVNPKGVSIYGEELAKLPTSWNAGMRLDAQLAATKPQDRPKLLQDSLAQQAAMVAGAAMQGKDQYAAALANVDPKFAGLFTPPAQYDPKATPDNARTVGQSVEQAVTNAFKAGQLNVAEGKAEVYKELADVRESLLRQQLALGGGVGGFGAGSPNANLTGEEFLATLPVGQANQIRAMSEGRMTAPTASARTPAAIALRNALLQYDPQFSEQRAQIRKAFTTGKDGTNIGALNTAPVHLDQMAEAAAAMKNGTFQPGNAVYNYIATKFGASAPTNYKFVMNALAGEAASALKGTATDPEISHIMETLHSDMSPEQAAGVAKTGLHVLAAKLNTYAERYQQQLGEKDTHWSPVLPSAQRVFDKYGIGLTEKPAETPAGGRGGANASPPLPVTLSSSDVGKTYTNRAGQQITITAVDPSNGTQFKFDPAGKAAAAPAASGPKKTYTEAEVRAKAIAAKANPDDAVAAAKAAGLLK